MARQVEIFVAGCPLCEDAIQLVNELACPNCEVAVLSLNQKEGLTRAREYGITSVPTVVVDGRVVECCQRSIDADTLRAAGVGQPS